MWAYQLPPSRKSIRASGIVKPFGADHICRCAGVLHISKTRARGASKIRTISSCVAAAPPACALLAFLWATLFLLRLQLT